MRRILVDHARGKRAYKQGGDWKRIDQWDPALPADDSDLLALDEALAALAEVDPQAAELVELRYFAGASIPLAAETLNISPRTADRLWSYSRAWLFQRISGEKLA